MFNGMVTTVLSETLVQNIVGVGFASAEQFKVNTAGALVIWPLEVSMVLGGPKNKLILC